VKYSFAIHSHIPDNITEKTKVPLLPHKDR